MGSPPSTDMKAVLFLVFLLCFLAFGEDKSNQSLKVNKEHKLTIREASPGKSPGKGGKIKKMRKKKKIGKNVKSKKKYSKAKKIKIREKIRKADKKKGKENQRNSQRQSCASGVSQECLKNAKDVLIFEAYQRNNFLKQYKRFINHNKTSIQKWDKKGIFGAPKKYLEDAGGGNVSAISCNSDNTTRSFNANYTFLSNCSELVNEVCNLTNLATYPSADIIAAMDKCNVEMEKTKDITSACQTEEMGKDGAAQCSCWENAKDHMDLIRSYQPKCTGMQKIAKQMKTDKKVCIDTFILCKKAEDASVRLISECMQFNSQDLDQAQIAKEAGAEIIG